jgi:formamidopyrimidine-DNA glycosylase
MPELPEVELVVRSLRKAIVGRKILTAELLYRRLAPGHSPKNFAKTLRDAEIHSVERRGKFILFKFVSENTLVTHLRMSGRFLLLQPDNETPKHTNAVFYFDDETRLVFNDQRHFGLMKIAKNGQLDKLFSDLAPEPLGDEFTPDYLHNVMQASRRSIKEFLLDQTKVCGLGNIYASETLFISKINPKTPANKISWKRSAPLHSAIQQVLSESIEHGSTLNIDPNRIEDSYYGGGYEKHWRVYDQEGELCQDCRAPIKRIVQGSRSTYYCPRCQRR